MGRERSHLSLFNLAGRGRESCSQPFSPDQGLGSTLFMPFHFCKDQGLAVPVIRIGPRRGGFAPSPSLSRLISHNSQLYKATAAQLGSSKL